jgi:hypothetical protein
MKIHIRKIGLFVSVFLTAIILHGSKAFAAAPSMIDTTVRIVWEDEEDQDHARPEEVTITLYANGNEIGRSMTLSAENDWEGTFESLPVYIEDERQSYSVVEEKIDGYTGAIAGSDTDGYTITNIHAPLPKGRSGEEEIVRLDDMPQSQAEGMIVETVVTTKVSKSMPARTSTTIKKTMSAKTADTSETVYWGGTLLGAITALFIWMRIEQKRK